jgi:hypothetical protein
MKTAHEYRRTYRPHEVTRYLSQGIKPLITDLFPREEKCECEFIIARSDGRLAFQGRALNVRATEW